MSVNIAYGSLSQTLSCPGPHTLGATERIGRKEQVGGLPEAFIANRRKSMWNFDFIFLSDPLSGSLFQFSYKSYFINTYTAGDTFICGGLVVVSQAGRTSSLSKWERLGGCLNSLCQSFCVSSPAWAFGGKRRAKLARMGGGSCAFADTRWHCYEFVFEKGCWCVRD